ncbi:hypothetical protein ACFW9X_30230 [Streptomyces sp. NPDC059466]|uniref:hypothetical protein n=1 Tax=Streptomyces sp. NPDC059466 TaxID=3346843 RepID=UPI0036A974BA
MLAGGTDRMRDVLGPVFGALGGATVWLGPAGDGTKAELVLNNWLVGAWLAERRGAARRRRSGRGVHHRLTRPARESMRRREAVGTDSPRGRGPTTGEVSAEPRGHA